jgi:hypothetical protein
MTGTFRRLKRTCQYFNALKLINKQVAFNTVLLGYYTPKNGWKSH